MCKTERRKQSIERDGWEDSCVYTEEEMARGREGGRDEKRKEYV